MEGNRRFQKTKVRSSKLEKTRKSGHIQIAWLIRNPEHKTTQDKQAVEGRQTDSYRNRVLPPCRISEQSKLTSLMTRKSKISPNSND